MNYQYEIVRELKSHARVSRHIYLFDFFTIVGVLGVSLILEPAVYPLSIMLILWPWVLF